MRAARAPPHPGDGRDDDPALPRQAGDARDRPGRRDCRARASSTSSTTSACASSAGGCRRPGCSSRATRPVRSASARSPAKRSCSPSPTRSGDERSYFLVEEYVPGDVCHVDSIVYENEVLAAVASQYGTPPFDVSHGGGVFTTRLLDARSDEARALVELNREVLAALGLVRGVSHTEFIRARDGRLYFLETSARVGGAHIADLIEAGTGVNMWAEWAKIEAAGGKAPYARSADARRLRRPAGLPGPAGAPRPERLPGPRGRLAPQKAASCRGHRRLAGGGPGGRSCWPTTPAASARISWRRCRRRRPRFRDARLTLMRQVTLVALALLLWSGQPRRRAASSGMRTSAAQAADWYQWRGPNRDGHSAETGLLQQWPANGPSRLVGVFRRRRRLLVVFGITGTPVHARRPRRRRVRDGVRRADRPRSCGRRPTAAASVTIAATARAARRPWTATASTRSAAAARWPRSIPPPARSTGRSTSSAPSAAACRTGATANRRSSSATASWSTPADAARRSWPSTRPMARSCGASTTTRRATRRRCCCAPAASSRWCSSPVSGRWRSIRATAGCCGPTAAPRTARPTSPRRWCAATGCSSRQATAPAPAWSRCARQA